MRYVFRQPHFPAIIAVGDRVFATESTTGLKKLLRREMQPGLKVRLLDVTWEWFELLLDLEVIAPPFLDRAPPTQRSLIRLVNSRRNRAEGAPLYEPRSLSNHTRDDIFAQLLALLPTG